jgi:hypothetical protein
LKRKIKIAKNVAKVPERRTKMRRKKREKKFRQVVLQTGNFHFRIGRVCGVCGCLIFGAVLGR